jgi:hypothetical protein
MEAGLIRYVRSAVTDARCPSLRKLLTSFPPGKETRRRRVAVLRCGRRRAGRGVGDAADKSQPEDSETIGDIRGRARRCRWRWSARLQLEVERPSFVGGACSAGGRFGSHLAFPRRYDAVRWLANEWTVVLEGLRDVN